jgi:hypothetical protein
VLVRGLAEVVANDETARLGRDLPEPIVMHPGTRVFSIRLDAVTGRAISHDHFIFDVQLPPSGPAKVIYEPAVPSVSQIGDFW